MTNVSPRIDHPATEEGAADPESRCWALLEELGELRKDRLTTPGGYRYGVHFCGPLIGALAIFSGYAVFLALWEQVHEDHGSFTLIFELLGAVGAVAIVEWIKEVIEFGAHPHHATRHVARHPALILSSVLLLFAFELFVLAAETVTHAASDVDWSEMFTPEFITGGRLDLVVQTLIGVFIGAGVTLALSRGVFRATGGVAAQMKTNAATGALYGLVVAPVLTVIYVTAAHFSVWLLGHVPPVLLTTDSGAGAALAGLFEPRAIAARPELLGNLVVAGVTAYCAHQLKFRLLAVGAIGIGTAVLGPVAILYGHSFVLALIASAMCGVAGLVLGSVAPLMRLSSPFPHSTWPWLLAFGGSLVVVGGWSGAYWLSAPAVIVGVTSLAVRRRLLIRDYWPLLALTAAVVVSALGWTLTQTFQSTFAEPLKALHFEGTIDYEKYVVDPEALGSIFNLFVLSVMGSLGFWGSIGLLMTWQIQTHQDRLHRGANGEARCFWSGDAALQQYHDATHGTLPSTDRDLLARLTYDSLSPAFVAANERALKAYYAQRGLTGMSDSGTQILNELLQWTDDPVRALACFRAHFVVTDGFALGSFLQAVGVLPGAHFKGCFLHDAREQDRIHRLTVFRAVSSSHSDLSSMEKSRA